MDTPYWFGASQTFRTTIQTFWRCAWVWCGCCMCKCIAWLMRNRCHVVYLWVYPYVIVIYVSIWKYMKISLISIFQSIYLSKHTGHKLCSLHFYSSFFHLTLLFNLFIWKGCVLCTEAGFVGVYVLRLCVPSLDYLDGLFSELAMRGAVTPHNLLLRGCCNLATVPSLYTLAANVTCDVMEAKLPCALCALLRCTHLGVGRWISTIIIVWFSAALLALGLWYFQNVFMALC